MAARAGRRAALRLLHASLLRPQAEALPRWLDCCGGSAAAAQQTAAGQDQLRQHQQRRWTTGPGKGTTHNTTFPKDPPYHPQEDPMVTITHKRGVDILHDPVLNKGTATPMNERERLGLRGLLPPRVVPMDVQLQRIKDDYYLGKDWVDLDDASVTKDHVRKWRVLQDLKDRNETLYYRLLIDDFTHMAPIVYTPTVGWASVNFHHVYRRPRGMFFSLKDRNEMAAMVHNWPADNVDAIVVTDGSRILGLGDLGINGMAIPIGKLDLYVGAAGFNPGRVLPCVIDVGTDNEALQNLDLYMGLHQPRITDQDLYRDIMDEFVKAVMSRWPNAVLQFEDFNMAHAQPLLERYRDHHLVFNDDIQGTAATAVAGLYGAMKVKGLPKSALKDQRFVVAGAGSAGMGVVRMICQAIEVQGADEGTACKNFWIVDAKGLITDQRPALSDVVQPFARSTVDSADVDREKLLEVIKRVKPNILIGLTGYRGLFTPEILQEMAKYNDRPIIFAMSNPTSRLECTAEEAQKYTGGRAIFASGSPQPDVVMNGKKIASSQISAQYTVLRKANNMYIFPGLALGAHLGKTGTITDMMIQTCAEALPELITPEDLRLGYVFPRLSDARAISAKLAFDVMMEAHHAGHMRNKKAQRELAVGGEAALSEYIEQHMYEPTYTSLVHLDT